MPSPQSETLVRAFRAAQIELSLVAAAKVRDAWDTIVKPGDIQGSATKWLTLATAIIVRYRADSAAQGATYYAAMRAIELPNASPFAPPAPDLLGVEFLRSSLWVMGPGELLKAKEGIAPDATDPILQIMVAKRALGDVIEATTIRHTQNGGRNAIDQARELDPVAVGYYRETDGDPCYFCLALSSRGVVYKEDSFDESDARFEGPGECKVHDSCACHNRPMFVRGDQFPGMTKQANGLWLSLPTTYNGAPTSGANAIRAFRHLVNEAKQNKS